MAAQVEKKKPGEEQKPAALFTLPKNEEHVNEYVWIYHKNESNMVSLVMLDSWKCIAYIQASQGC